MVGISSASFYSCVWKVIAAINQAEELKVSFPLTIDDCMEAATGFLSISTAEVIDFCVGAVDGYHLQIKTPTRKEANDNVRKFYSGHYCTYGLNIQAVCDHHCRFTYFAVCGPGSQPDRVAIEVCDLFNKVKELPGLYFIIADCAYNATEHIVPIYGGPQALSPRNDNFNYYCSQCRIRVEMAFGLMFKKFDILHEALQISLKHVLPLMTCIARLHNYFINERLAANLSPFSRHRGRVPMPERDELLRAASAVVEFGDLASNKYACTSGNRQRLVESVESKGLVRPRG